MPVELFASTIGSSAASTTLSGNGGSITSGATTLKVASATGFSVTGGQMRAVIEPGTANAEVVIITGISGLTFTVTRGAETAGGGTAHNDGSVFIAEITAGALGNMLQTPAGSDGQYFIRRSGLWVPDTPSYADLAGVPASFAPSAHATTHASGGSDAVTLAPAQVTGTAVVTADARLSDTRTPTDGTVTDATVNSSAAIAESKLALASDAVAATASRRTLGTGSTQAAAGNDSRLTNARTPTTHAASHLRSGSDDLSQLLRATTTPPSIHAYLAWAFDFKFLGQGLAPTAGVIYLVKLLTSEAFTINNIHTIVSQAGSGATALANCFVGIYDSGGTRRFVSSDQTSAWNNVGGAGLKTANVSGGYAVTANDFIYIAYLIGTQSSTACQLRGANIGVSTYAAFNLTAATALFATNGTLQTSLPTPTITLASNASTATAFWAAVY